MARKKKEPIVLICKNEECKNEFIKKTKTQQFCKQSCSQTWKKTNKEWLEKRYNTNLKRYGVKSPLESNEIKKTYKKNLKEKYGVECAFQIEGVKEKSKQTTLNHFGVEHHMQLKQYQDNLSEYRRGKSFNRDTRINLRWKIIQKHCEENNLIPLFEKHLLENNFIIDLKNVPFKCNKCKVILETQIRNGYLPNCKYCSVYKGYSSIEEELINFIKDSYDTGDIILKTRKLLLGNKEVDIFLPSSNIAIEMNGIYWHSEIWGKYKNYHLDKTQELLEKDIRLIHILDHEWVNKKPIIQSMLLNYIGKTQYKIYARKCEIKEISFKLKNEFFIKNHIQGDCPSKFNIGLFDNNELVSCISFGKERFKKDSISYELLRFCNKLNTNVIGGASRLFKYFLKTNNPEKIITFADRRFSQGNLYYQLGFNFIEFTKPNYIYWKNFKTYNRIYFQKHKLKNKLDIFDINKSEYENMIDNGYNRVWDCGNYKFEYVHKIKNPG